VNESRTNESYLRILYVCPILGIAIDNIPEEKVEKDANINSVAFKDLERWSVAQRLLSCVVHNAADML